MKIHLVLHAHGNDMRTEETSGDSAVVVTGDSAVFAAVVGAALPIAGV